MRFLFELLCVTAASTLLAYGCYVWAVSLGEGIAGLYGM